MLTIYYGLLSLYIGILFSRIKFSNCSYHCNDTIICSLVLGYTWLRLSMSTTKVSARKSIQECLLSQERVIPGNLGSLADFLRRRVCRNSSKGHEEAMMAVANVGLFFNFFCSIFLAWHDMNPMPDPSPSSLWSQCWD